jgi:hypothetical protein
MAIDSYPVKKLIAFTTDQWKQVHAFRFANEINTESEAVRRLVNLGLEYARKTPALSEEAQPRKRG